MNAIKPANNNITANTIQPPQEALILEFIKSIDRCEKTAKTYTTNLRQFFAWMRYEGITAPTRDDIILYRDSLLAEHEAIVFAPSSMLGWKYRTDATGEPIRTKCKANTVKIYIQSVKQFFGWTASEGYYPNIADGVHVPTTNRDEHKKDALTAADVLTIEKSITANAEQKATAAAENRKDTAGRVERATEQGKRLFAMYQLAVTAGLRTIELSRANVGDIETTNGNAVIFVHGKGHTEADQRKPIPPQVYDAILDYLNSRQDKPKKDAPLFVATGNRSGGKRLATTTISTMLKRAMQAGGYDSERLTAHSLRHTAGTNAMELTGDLYQTQIYMRHANPATTEIYLHVDSDRQQADIAQRLYNKYHGVEEDDAAAQLNTIIAGMNADQLRTLAAIAGNIK